MSQNPSSLPPLNRNDENYQRLPPILNFPDISGDNLNSSNKEDPSKTSQSNSNFIKAIYPRISNNSVQEASQFNRKPLIDLTNNYFSHNLPFSQSQTIDKNLQSSQDQIPYRLFERKNLTLDNLNPKSHLSSTSFHAISHFMNPRTLQSLENKQVYKRKSQQKNPKSSFFPDIETSLEEEEEILSSFQRIQPKGIPILAKGNLSNYIDTTIKDMHVPDEISEIGEGETGPNTELETEDFQEMKKTEKELGEGIAKREDLNAEWLQLSKEVRRLATLGQIKKAYDAWMGGKHLWEHFLKNFNPNFYHTAYCLTFVQYLGNMFREALPTLKRMEEFYYKNGGNGDLGDKDIGHLYTEIAKCYSSIGEEGYKEEAEKYLSMAKERLERDEKERLFIFIHCLSTHGAHFMKYKNYQIAQEHFEAAFELTRRLGKEQGHGQPSKDCLLGWAYIDLADVLISQGNFVDGKWNLRLATKRLKVGKLKNSFFMAKVKRNQARLTGNVEVSVRIYEYALKILKKTLPVGNQLEIEYEKECNFMKEKSLKAAKKSEIQFL